MNKKEIKHDVNMIQREVDNLYEFLDGCYSMADEDGHVAYSFSCARNRAMEVLALARELLDLLEEEEAQECT